MPSAPALRRPQPLPVRLAHWVHVWALGVMAGSGLEIYKAFPALGPRGALYAWFPFQGSSPPGALRLGGWLAGARHWHFAAAWVLVLNALGYLAYLAVSGEWRRRFFLPRRDLRGAVHTLAWYLRLRRTAPAQGLYNGLQRLTYTGVFGLGILSVLSGFAILLPARLQPLTALLGGYDPARAVHFVSLVLFALFTVMHVVLVALHPRTFVEMLAGGRPAPVAPGDARVPRTPPPAP